MFSRRNISAFTLIEVLITVVILSMGIVVVMQAFNTSMLALSRSRDVLCGAVLCREKLTDIETDIAAGNAPDSFAEGMFKGVFADYQWSVETMPVPVAGMNSATGGKREEKDEVNVNLYKVKVAVWKSGHPLERQETETYLKM